jgi:serine/threonine protein kinase
MEFVEGQNLAAITEMSPLTGPLLTALAEGLIEALEAIHSCDVVHRDLKPQNILYGSAGVMVVDFGTSVLAEVAGATRTGELTGTPGWLAPEQALGHTLTPAADIFNFGMVLAYAATGQHPFGQGRPDAMLFRIVHQEPDLSAVPERLKLVVAQCLEKKPSDRPTLDEIRRSLSLGESGSGSSGGPSDPRTRLGSTTRIGAQAVQDAGAVSRPPRPLEKLTKRQRIATGSTAAAIALLATAVLIVGRAGASGPVEYTVVDNSTRANVVVSEPVVRLRSGSQEATLSLKDKPSTRTQVDELVWSTDHPLIIDYLPGFANDESTTLRIDLSALGNNRMTRGWRTLLDVQIFDDLVQLTVRAPETRLVFLRGRDVAEDVRLERQNETEYLRMVAMQLGEAQAAARRARTQCSTDLNQLTRTRMAPVFDLELKYNRSILNNRLTQDASTRSVLRTRISGLLKDMDADRGLTQSARLPDGFADPNTLGDAFSNVVWGHISLSIAWDRYRLALLSERSDAFSDERQAIVNAQSQFEVLIREASKVAFGAAIATCDALHPIPEG